MYKPIMNPHTEKGRTLILLDKRNKQFHALFLRIKDPVSILQFYTAISEIYEKYFGDEKRSEQWMRFLIYLNDHGFCWRSDLKDKLGFDKAETNSVLKKMGWRNLVDVDKSRHEHLYKLSVDGMLFLKNFSKESVSEMMKVVRNGRTGKKRITSSGIFKHGSNTAAR